MEIPGVPAVIGEAPATEKEKAAKDKLLASVVNEAGASQERKAFLARINMLSPQIQKALLEDRAGFSDFSAYCVADSEGNRTRVFMEDSKIKTGISNLSEAKLKKSRPMLVDTIHIYYSTSTTEGGSLPEAFEPETFSLGLMNGEFELNIDGANVIPRTPISDFVTVFSADSATGDNTRPYGSLKLKNPILIPPQVVIEPVIHTVGDPEECAFKVVLKGSMLVVKQAKINEGDE